MVEEIEWQAFRAKFQVERLLVYENADWCLSVRPEQFTLGSLVVSAKGRAARFAELIATERMSFLEMLAIAESVVMELYGAKRINALCLMMKDPLVHFHILPRYDKPVLRHGMKWVDDSWPGPPVLGPAETDRRILDVLVQEIKQEIGQI